LLTSPEGTLLAEDVFKTSVPVINEYSGKVEFKEEGEAVLEAVLLDAKKCAEIKSDFISVKNSFKNRLLNAYASDKFEPAQVEALIKEYT
jgi:hypothetical protein